MNILKSIGAVLAGFVVVVVLSLVADELMRKAGNLPPLGQRAADGSLLVATIYRTIFSVIGSYITARLAPNRPMGHALVGGAIGLVLSIVGAAVTWNKGPAFGPHWYPLALIVLAMPQSWLGGKIRLMQMSTRTDV
jgi:uncharacterized membrane protein